MYPRYADSLRTFGLLVAATLAFDLGVFAFKGDTAALDFLAAYVVEDRWLRRVWA